MVLALLIGETLLLVLLSILVVGLLRSHAEVLRRLGAPGATGSEAGAPPRSEAGRQEGQPATDVAGETLEGDAVQVGLRPGGPSTLLAFLSSGCTVCEGIWRQFPEHRRALPKQVRPVVVVKDARHERPSRLRELAPPDAPVVMSSAAWRDYSVPTTPFFVYVDGPSGRVHGEGTASSWEQIASLLADAIDDTETEERGPNGSTAAVPSPAAERARRAERALDEAGIGPGHPSLYPSGGEGAGG